MSHLFESIRVINGNVRNLKYHQSRVDRVFLFYGKKDKLNLRSVIKSLSIPKDGLFKLRISYDIHHNSIRSKIETYKAKEINSLRLIELKEESYKHKFEDRKFINSYYEKRGNASDVLFYRNNKILDTSYCNIAFFTKKEWLTPKIPLLKGTMREQLLNKGIIVEKDIYLEDIQHFKKARLFNAMILWSDKKEVSNFYE